MTVSGNVRLGTVENRVCTADERVVYVNITNCPTLTRIVQAEYRNWARLNFTDSDQQTHHRRNCRNPKHLNALQQS